MKNQRIHQEKKIKNGEESNTNNIHNSDDSDHSNNRCK